MFTLIFNDSPALSLSADSIRFVGYMPRSTGAKRRKKSEVEQVRLMKQIISLEKKLMHIWK